MAVKVLMGVFETEEGILNAARTTHKEGFSIDDVYTPFPVHGMDEAMGLPTSRIPRFAFLYGLTGLISALFFQFWVGARSWPINIGGKPFNALPAYIPVGFEVMVLFAALGSVATLFFLRGLIPGAAARQPHSGINNDRFVITFDKDIPESGFEELRVLLKELGARGMILTNAAGAANPSFKIGQLMVVRDFIESSFGEVEKLVRDTLSETELAQASFDQEWLAIARKIVQTQILTTWH